MCWVRSFHWSEWAPSQSQVISTYNTSTWSSGFKRSRLLVMIIVRATKMETTIIVVSLQHKFYNDQDHESHNVCRALMSSSLDFLFSFIYILYSILYTVIVYWTGTMHLLHQLELKAYIHLRSLAGFHCHFTTRRSCWVHICRLSVWSLNVSN